VRTIGEQGRRLQRLVTQILDLSRIQMGMFALEPRPLDLSAVVQSVVEEFRPTLRQHDLRLEGVAEPAIVDGDQRALEQVLLNLLGNAVKYSPRGGPIMVRLEQQDGSAALTVGDQGIGIPMAAQPHLFQRFYRATNVRADQFSGFGLGLYLVKEIVSRHNGSVEVASTEGQGSAFTVRLPLASPQHEPR
jgi:signal transduction histidine kinase